MCSNTSTITSINNTASSGYKAISSISQNDEIRDSKIISTSYQPSAGLVSNSEASKLTIGKSGQCNYPFYRDNINASLQLSTAKKFSSYDQAAQWLSLPEAVSSISVVESFVKK